MEINRHSRRHFIKQNSIAGMGAGMGMTFSSENARSFFGLKTSSKAALLGGEPVRDKGWPSWPIWNPETDEKRLIEVMRSGVWSRRNVVTEFEQEWAKTIGVKRCLAVVNGTNALNASLAQLEIGWGDEVIVSPYSFIASVSCILFNGAIPIFVDVDPETFQMDPSKIEEKITRHTKAILPVHILGYPCDMDPIMQIARKHNLLVVEDACQGWLAEYNHKKVGTFGHAGCFSFQNSKNMPIGEGGAIVSDDEEFMDRCYSFHNYGNAYGSVVDSLGSGPVMVGTKLRITEYQAAIGLSQLVRLEDQTNTRSANAEYLRAQLIKIPGILPYRLYEKVTRASFHLFAFRYQEESFKGLTRSRFLEAMRAEGIPCSSGYKPLNKMSYLKNAFESRNFKKFYETDRLNYKKYEDQNECLLCDDLCDEAVWLSQNLLLGTRSDMDDIVRAIEKVGNNAESLK